MPETRSLKVPAGRSNEVFGRDRQILKDRGGSMGLTEGACYPIGIIKLKEAIAIPEVDIYELRLGAAYSDKCDRLNPHRCKTSFSH